MKAYNRTLLTLILACSVGTTTYAQSSGSNSPYSRYGWGQMQDDAQGFNKSMAGVALGARGKWLLNRQNPASYSAIDSITFLFDAGLSMQNGHWSESGKSTNALNATLDYVECAFRLRKGIGLSLGMRPITIVGYNFSNEQTLPDIDGYGEYTATTSYEGNGGTRQVYLGLGIQLFKPLSLGFNAGYIWGDYTHNSAISYSETSIHSLARAYSATINTWSLDFGLQYALPFGKKDMLTLGLTYGLGHKINDQSVLINQIKTSSSVIGADTTRVKKAFELPQNLGAGLTYNHDGRLTVAIDYTLQKWDRCRMPVLTADNASASYQVSTTAFKDRHHVALGCEYIPKPDGIKFTDHIAYRAGVSYTTSYFKVNGSSGPKDYLVTLGAGIPIVNSYNNRSTLNLALQWEHLAPGSASTLKEDYLRLAVGLTFNANWFNKWKIE